MIITMKGIIANLFGESFHIIYFFYNTKLPKQNLQTKFDNFPWLNNKNELKKWQKA